MRNLAFCVALVLPFPVLAQPAFTPSASDSITAPAGESETAITDEPGDSLPDPIPDGQEAQVVVESLQEMRQLANSGLWGPFVSALITFVMLLFSTLFIRFKLFRDWIRPYYGEIVLFFPVAVSLAHSFKDIPAGSGWGPWGEAIWIGLQVGGTSVLFYEVIFKRWIRPLLQKLWNYIRAKLEKKAETSP